MSINIYVKKQKNTWMFWILGTLGNKLGQLEDMGIFNQFQDIGQLQSIVWKTTASPWLFS